MAEVQGPPPTVPLNLKLEAPDYAAVTAEQEDPVIELGDRIRLSGGKYDGTTGRVIYRTFDKLHLMPDGLTHSALEFTLTEDGFEEESGIEAVEILQKRKKPALVDILDLATGQLLETFDEEGNASGIYKIKKVDSDLDNLVVEGADGEEVDLRFGFRGIDESMPFRVIRGRQAPEKPATVISDGTTEDEQSLSEANDGSEPEDEVEDFTFLDDELEETPAEEDEVQRLVEIPTSERIYSNMRQKSEAYADLLSFNSDALQKLESTQKSTRVLTELFFQLRGAIMRTSEDGIPKGVKPTSIQTLIDLLETRGFELSRTVLDIDKIVYYDADPDVYPQPESMEGLRLQYFNKKIIDAINYIESSTDMEGQKYTQFLNGFLSRFGATWRSNTTAGIGAQAFQRDEEAFRLKVPDSDSSIPGYAAGLPNKKEAYLTSELISEVSMSLVRGLKAVRSKGKLLEIGEEAAVIAHVVFPLAYAASLSIARQESLTADIQAGLLHGLSMSEILKKTGEITDIPSMNQAFLVSTEGGTLGNIPLREYIKSTDLKLEGMGDIWTLQVLMGMREKEWTIDQHAAIQEKITQTHEQILDFILRQRETLAKQAAQPPTIQGIQMTPDGPAMIQKLADEPILKDFQQNIKDQMPSFAASDVALVGLILRQHSDLAFAQLADQPAALTRNRMKYAREEYLTTIRNTQLYKQRISFAGEPPEPVNCPHVKPLEMIRKVKDDKKRFALLAKFLTTFQGSKQDSWVNCRIGDHHLLCVHELLQVYQFLRPGDASVLNKDIQLTFGGGQHMGAYICRNCGQPISELEYDTHLEFDDQGKPMMGRSELVDQDAVTQQEIDELIGPLGDLEEPVEFDNETKKLIFSTARQMADKIFAPLESSDYMTLVARAFGVLQQIPERDRYIKIQKARTKGRAAAQAAAADFGADYDIYINQALVCAVGVHLLLIIQSKKPDFILRGIASGCRSLRGEPLEPDGGNHGIQCIVSVIASFQKDAPPWSLTQFQREKDDTIRNRMVMDVFEPILKAALQDPTILQALAQKRDYKRKILGLSGGQGRPDEEIPPNFAPIPFVMKPEDFVEKIIIPEAASPKDRAELWVRQGNHLARTTKLPKPIAYSEASCCLSPINKIDEFWVKSASSLPPFKKLAGLPAPPKIMRFEPTMKPSVISRPLPDAPEKSYYLLFLKVCHEGEKKGHSHEFGLTHKCIWCDLKLPKEVELLTADQGRTAIESQGIDVSKESFEDLLNETHRVNSFRTKLLLEIPGQLDNWVKLTEMDPEPTEGFRAMMARTQVELMKLPPDAKVVEVAVALSEFSTFVMDLEGQFKARISAAQHAIFDQILKDGSESIIRFLQSYVIVPLKQFISKRAADPRIPDSWELSFQHQMDVQALLREHRSYLTKFNKVQATPWLTAKVDTVLQQTRATLDALMSLRPLQVPGGEQTFEFFMKMCLYGPLANFVDPNVQPLTTAEAPSSQVEQHALFPARFISDMAARFKVEGSHLTPEQIRELIAERNEKEKANIIKKMNDMSRAGKDIEKIKIKLGIGEYAVGGTKAIYAYDQERYDIEREERAQAGIIDFPGRGPEGPGEAIGAEDQRPVDGLGYYETGEEGGYIGDEELGEINGFDDDN